MKRVVLFLAPIFFGLLIFFGFVFLLSYNKAGKGALQVTSVPASKVYLNGVYIGKTPLCRCEGNNQISAGTYSLKLVPLVGDNLSPYEDTITISNRILTVVDRTFGVGEFSTGSVITLSPLSNPSATELFISSVPGGATVTLDGNIAGTTPLLLKSVTPSDHDILLSENGFESKTVHVHTATGYTLSAVITLGVTPISATPSAQDVLLTPTSAPSIVILTTPTGFLRVRSDPSLTASETAQVKPGDTFPFVDEQNGWYEIQLPDKTNGWVSMQYAEKK